jgi:hypothetical protein
MSVKGRLLCGVALAGSVACSAPGAKVSDRQPVGDAATPPVLRFLEVEPVKRVILAEKKWSPPEKMKWVGVFLRHDCPPARNEHFGTFRVVDADSIVLTDVAGGTHPAIHVDLDTGAISEIRELALSCDAGCQSYRFMLFFQLAGQAEPAKLRVGSLEFDLVADQKAEPPSGSPCGRGNPMSLKEPQAAFAVLQ